ncbi:penicillin-binding protein 1B [Oceanicoccus sagamiensis]|uniref:Penicillin-binding protein 1B n=2 Tax=Oceanicoccus sagamiensis TaxID=716816 RepID=A0A1X9N8R0_9GAMM|nr:penicillin-binding protein 1B [Oceanicoccus sagamiensis]
MLAKKKKKPSPAFPWWKMCLALAVLLMGALIYLDAKVRYSLHERQWQLPARVYARALSLYPQKLLAADDLHRELKQLGYQAGDDRQPGSVRREGDQFWIYSRGFQSPDYTVKPLRFSVRFNNNTVVQLERIGGSALSRVQLEPMEIGSIYSSHREDRLLVKLEQVPQSLRDILLLIEDRDFYQHLGLSPRAIARAMLTNIKAGRTLQGGSTITQQLVKNVFLSSDRRLWRKGVEAIMSLLVELHFSKDEILQSYLNEVYLGQEGPRAIHGFALASRHYFNRPLAELDASQIALLVGMVKGPSYYDPWRNPERATERRNTVLQVMAKHQLISPQQQQQFAGQPLGLAKANALANVYPAYLDLVRRQLRRDYSKQSLQTKGMKIFTAFDPIVQRHAELSLASMLKDKAAEQQAAMVVTDVNNGDVVAVVGGRQMRYAGFNRALDAVRPIGSLIKPAVYLAALQQPKRYTLATSISDGPVEVKGRDGSLWQPRNFDRKSHGQVLLHRALAKSYNQATARLGMDVGLAEVIDVVANLGVKRSVAPLPSMLLGAVALSPLEVASMYQTIASTGVYSPLRSIVDIADNNGKAVARYPVVQQQVIAKPVMHLLHYAMVEVVEEGTGKLVYQSLPRAYRVAGKTGTTNDLRDSWFAGFAGDYLAVVWMGRDDNKSAGLTGSAGALTVWREFIARASHRPLDFSVPPGIAYHWVNEETGLLSREVCEGSRYMPFLQGTAPTQRDSCDASLPGVIRWFKNLF